MKFSVQLSCDYPDPAYGGKQLYADMIEQALLADRLGFDAVSITEHHLINLLMMPAPLQFAVKIAGVTERVKIILGSRYCHCTTCGCTLANWSVPTYLPIIGC